MVQCYMSRGLLLLSFYSLLFLVLNFSTSRVASAPRRAPPPPTPPPPPPPAPPAHLILALQWPKAVCTAKEVCLIVPKIFTIHGLWGGADAESCSTVPIDMTLFREPLKSNLRKYWVNAKATTKVAYESISSALTFWLYEYKKHGGCTNLDQVSYFQKTVDLYMANNITKIVYNNFASSVINGLPIDTDSLWQKINIELGAKTVMVCATNTALLEVRLYIQTSNWKAVDYPGARKCTSATVVFAK